MAFFSALYTPNDSNNNTKTLFGFFYSEKSENF